MQGKLTVRQLIEDLNLTLYAGESGLHNLIKESFIARPGMELAGLFDFYDFNRLQILGSKEVTFFHWLNENDKRIRVEMLFEKKPPVFIFSRNVEIPNEFIEFSEKYNVPVCKSELRSNPLFGELYEYLQNKLAERTTMHGVLMDIDGVGVMFRGKSGIGKSEIALELVKRGHQLVADDRVDIYQKEKGHLLGEAPPLLQKYLEIRGIGIVNVVQLFGAKAFREIKTIMLLIDLEKWDESIEYDRLGIEDGKYQIFDTEVSYLKIPVTEARNIASLIEVAAMNHRLKYLGYNAALEFTQKLEKAIKNKQ